MHDEEGTELMKQKLLDMQTALFNLRDGLVNLSLSLQELSFLTDETIQQESLRQTEDILTRLRK